MGFPWRRTNTAKEVPLVAETRITLQDLVPTAEIDQTQSLKDAWEWLLQQSMEAEVATQIGADRYERIPERATRRNGYRGRLWATRWGPVQLAIP